MLKRLRVRIQAPNTYQLELHFFASFCCEIVCCKRPKINDKEAGDGLLNVLHIKPHHGGRPAV